VPESAAASRGRGVGSGLLARTVKAVARRHSRTGLYLWVLQQNMDAQAFYEARGAKRVERAQVAPPGGVPGRVNGSPHKLRYAWDDPGALVRQR
jgi:Acetyltransferase (GNAT) family